MAVLHRNKHFQAARKWDFHSTFCGGLCGFKHLLECSYIVLSNFFLLESETSSGYKWIISTSASPDSGPGVFADIMLCWWTLQVKKVLVERGEMRFACRLSEGRLPRASYPTFITEEGTRLRVRTVGIKISSPEGSLVIAVLRAPFLKQSHSGDCPTLFIKFI